MEEGTTRNDGRGRIENIDAGNSDASRDDAMTVVQTKPAPLCLFIRPASEDRELLPGEILLPSLPRTDCVTHGAALVFEIAPEEPHDFFLYGEVDVWYCVAVRRESGYLTISHPHGDVHREENLFTWCVRQQSSQPEQMTVRSLTAKARFTLEFPEEF